MAFATKPLRPRRRARARKAARHGRQLDRGVTMVEFALIAPVFFLLVLGLIVVSIIVTNQVQLTNAVRDGARAAAVCGGKGRQQGMKLPDGSACTSTNVINYIKAHLNGVPTNLTISVCLDTAGSGNCAPNAGGVDPLDSCSSNKSIDVNASYEQPLYVPFVGRIVGDNASQNTRHMTADAVAECEQ